eukprot:CAMPEP_0172557564 /NCGR_PEP_ID=MMETSP1067-20121228/73997_1 /TAXON_ID=265564 ORGANISM="Thalassiosira punctigera, Strain Tpunct2005C2" /NCGR_SAMPLE_ID=MMETSP1067 /ASSEMBLY_ACC=CAM_ASM_000444 /LENGTH=287 /DNA_ID=CAMNT_0013346685 /DNA_START=265 /DNA_END=1125 /DNA_ORIENTATION=+
MDIWNEWVQVGNGRNQCTTYSGVYKQRPAWGMKGDLTHMGQIHEEMTRHIMCCLKKPLGNEELFKALEVPTPTENGPGEDGPVVPPPHRTNATVPSDVHEMPLTPFDLEVRDTYRPFWFNSDDHDGWKGTTYEEGQAFCESIQTGQGLGQTFHLCPIKAYCPNGIETSTPLVYQMEPFDEGWQWAPISNAFNGWVMVGKFKEQRWDTCKTYLELNHRDPDWGIDGTQPELKKHLLCCQIYSGYDVTQSPSQSPVQEISIVPTTPTNEVVNAQSLSEQVSYPLGSDGA